MTKILNPKQNFWKSTALVLAILLALSLATIAILSLESTPKKIFGKFFTSQTDSSLVKPVSAAEIYPLFFCPCCGQPLDKNKICCGAAKERIDYIDSLTAQNLSENEVILAFVKKYGLNSFVDKNKAVEIREELVKTAPADRPRIVITPETYDFGDVSQKKGKTYTQFDLKNEGKSDLVINKLDTSCGCTFVSLNFKDKDSPFFTMPGHGSKNPEWEEVAIPPGETGRLKVMYDPSVHKDFRGPATREIYVFSNDPIDFEKKIQIDLNQVD